MSKEIRLVDFIDENISELTFHKILYFMYGLYYKEKKEVLYPNANFEAWQYGPVEINYRNDRNYFSEIMINKEQKKVLDEFLKIAKNMGIRKLVDLSHETRPWKIAGNYESIKNDVINDYFSSADFLEGMYEKEFKKQRKKKVGYNE